VDRTALDSALTEISNTPGSYTVYLASGTYSSPTGFIVSATNPTKIVGVGPTKPILTLSGGPSFPANTSVLTTTNQLGIDNIEIDIPDSTSVTGLTAAIGGQTISNVSVNGSANANLARGITVSDSNPRVLNAKVDLAGATTTGVLVSTSTSAIIDDLNVTHAAKGVSLLGAYNYKIRRLISHAGIGVDVANSAGTISSSLVLPSPVTAENVGGIGIDFNADSGDPFINRVDNCTLVGSGTGTTGVHEHGTNAGTDAIVHVNSSIITGYATSAGGSHDGGGNGSIDLAYTRYTGALSGDASADGTSQQTVADLGFVDAGNGNYHPSLSSPLVDAGDPTGLDTTDSATDASGEPRVISRGAGNIRDIGAYEVQNSAPVPHITVLTAVPSTTSSTEFSGASSTDAEGDSLTYDWKFDAMPGPSGATVKKMFIAEGPHSVQLTVTDKTGTSATTTTQINVARGFLAIKLRSQNATLTTKGTFKITMSCPPEAVSNCSGRLLFQTVKKVNAKDYTKRPGWIASKPDYLQAARYIFSIAPGTTQKLEVRTYSTFQNILGVHKKFQVQSTLVSGTTSNANLTANRATFTVSAPKSKKKK
jgi:hypothetical protein